jgi:hypothetical protein|tara:strand:+ start:276 stop:422 length:147 start_codon:yes stop_codon:yes gene_type:complete
MFWLKKIDQSETLWLRLNTNRKNIRERVGFVENEQPDLRPTLLKKRSF